MTEEKAKKMALTERQAALVPFVEGLADLAARMYLEGKFDHLEPGANDGASLGEVLERCARRQLNRAPRKPVPGLRRT